MSVKSASLQSRFGNCSSVSCHLVACHLHSVLTIIVDHRPKNVCPANLIVTLSLLPRSSTFHTVNPSGSVISLVGRLLSRHVPLKGCDMFVNLEKAKTCTRLSSESLIFK